jgi:hypothetical protein
MYIEAYQMLDNEPFQPDTSINQAQLKNTISENITIIINDLYAKHKTYKEQMIETNINEIFKNNNNNETNIQSVSNLKYIIENLNLVLLIIQKEKKELVLTDKDSKEFGIYIKPDVNFNDRFFVHISNNIIPNLYWQSTIQWIEV